MFESPQFIKYDPQTFVYIGFKAIVISNVGFDAEALLQLLKKVV